MGSIPTKSVEDDDMRKLSIALPKRVYGFILGSFCLGLQLTKIVNRTSFAWIATRIMRKPHKLYGLFTGKRFVGWGNVPKYNRRQLKNALVEIAKSKSHTSSNADFMDVQAAIRNVLKLDCNQTLSEEAEQEAIDFLEGKLLLQPRPTTFGLQVNHGIGSTLGLSKAANSPSTIKSRQNYRLGNVAHYEPQSVVEDMDANAAAWARASRDDAFPNSLPISEVTLDQECDELNEALTKFVK